MRRLVPIVFALLATAGVLAGCSRPEPAVSFYSTGHQVSTLPAQYCDSKVTTCYTATGVSATLRVPAGSPVQISVPSEVANAVWVVVFRYREPNGTTDSGRSAFFRPGSQYAYTLTMPNPVDQLVLAQVQQIGAITMAPTDTEPNYQAVRVWALSATS